MNLQQLLDGSAESYQQTPLARVDRIFQLFDTVRHPFLELNLSQTFSE